MGFDYEMLYLQTNQAACALYQWRELCADVKAARKIAQKYGFWDNDKETVEGAVRNILAVLIAETNRKGEGDAEVQR